MKRQQVLGMIVILHLALGMPLSTFALEVGDKAPLFEGASTQGDIRLTDYLGKKNVVLALYFAVFTPV
jgi:peroxiredoxin Q/BCP